MVTIVAHRGAPLQARENTLESFLAAVEAGAEMVELDVRRTRDNVLVTFHDPRLSRSLHAPLIKDLAYEELLRRTARKKYRVPTVQEVFAALAGRVMLDIELKEPGYEADVLGLARACMAVDKFILTSFDPAIIAAVKTFDPGVTCGLILAGEEAFSRCGDTPAEVLAPDKKLFAAHRAFFADLKKSGKRIAVWTVDGRADLSALLVDPIVEAVITNHPGKALALRNRLCNRT